MFNDNNIQIQKKPLVIMYQNRNPLHFSLCKKRSFIYILPKRKSHILDVMRQGEIQSENGYSMVVYNCIPHTSRERDVAHGAIGHWIDPSWGGPIELFLVPTSAPRLV